MSYSPLQNRLSLKNQYFIFILALDFVSMSNFTMKYEWFYNVLWNNIEFASYIYGEVITCKMNYFTFVVQPVEVWREGKKSGHASHQNLLPSLPDLGGGCMVSCYEVSQKIPYTIYLYVHFERLLPWRKNVIIWFKRILLLSLKILFLFQF